MICTQQLRGRAFDMPWAACLISWSRAFSPARAEVPAEPHESATQPPGKGLVFRRRQASAGGDAGGRSRGTDPGVALVLRRGPAACRRFRRPRPRASRRGARSEASRDARGRAHLSLARCSALVVSDRGSRGVRVRNAMLRLPARPWQRRRAPPEARASAFPPPLHARHAAGEGDVASPAVRGTRARLSTGGRPRRAGAARVL